MFYLKPGEIIPTTPAPPTNTTTTTQSTTKPTTVTAQPQVDVLSTTTTTTTTTTKSSDTTTPTYDGVPTYSFVEFSLTTKPSTAIAPVMLPLVSTKFNVKSNLYNQVNDTPVEWIEEYANTNSSGYANLKSKYCDLLTYYLKQGDSNAADGASCEQVTFTPVTSTRPDGTVIRSVVGDTTINVPTTTGTQLTGNQLYGLFINGYNKTSTAPSSIKLNALDVQRTSGTVTCSQFTNPCGEHATCRDSPPGITCFCNSMWKDMNLNDPGKQCVLHPAAIALIVLASLLLLAALILLLICLLRRRRRRNSSILASTDLATLNKLKETKSWKSKLDKNKIQLDGDQPVPLTGLPMPLTPTASNMIDGLPQRVGSALPLTGTAPPLSALRGSMPINGIQQIPASALPLTGTAPPLSALRGSMPINGIQQIPASPVPLTGLPMPLTPTASNMIDGLPQRVGSALPLTGTAPPLSALRGSMPINGIQQIPASPIQPTGLPMPLTPVGSNMTGGLQKIVGTQMLLTNMQIPKSPVITNMLTNASGSLPQNSMIPSTTIPQNNPSTNSNIFNFENLDKI
ncbi:unnamed protein product [Schistosoma haematobium]|nr:unnamed protein product [Schistosoma haematobium]